MNRQNRSVLTPRESDGSSKIARDNIAQLTIIFFRDMAAKWAETNVLRLSKKLIATKTWQSKTCFGHNPLIMRTPAKT